MAVHYNVGDAQFTATKNVSLPKQHIISKEGELIGDHVEPAALEEAANPGGIETGRVIVQKTTVEVIKIVSGIRECQLSANCIGATVLSETPGFHIESRNYHVACPQHV